MTDSLTDNGRIPTDTLSVTEAAVVLGVSERTVWRRIKAGKLRTAETPDGVRVRLPLPDRHLTDTDRQATDTPSVQQHNPELMKALELVDRLQRDNQQLAGQVGFLQARVQEQERTIARLMAPREEPAQSELESTQTPASTPAPMVSAPAPSRRPWWARAIRRLAGGE